MRLTNRLTFTLKAYFPQVLDWFRDKETAVFAAFLERWPSLLDAQRARRDFKSQIRDLKFKAGGAEEIRTPDL